MTKIPLLTKLNKGHLKEIANNHRLTKHAKIRIKERFNYERNGSVKMAILNSPLAFVNNDGSVSVGTKDGSIFKFVQPTKEKPFFYMITFYEPSLNKKSIYQKYKLTMKGYNR